jgi:hypothetical protein
MAVELAEYTVGGDTYTGRVYRAGTKAFLDTLFSGMIRCTVLAVLRRCNGRLIGHDDLTVRVDETKGGYREGEVLQRSAAYTPPRSQRYLRDHFYRINVNYVYEQGGSNGQDQGESAAGS